MNYITRLPKNKVSSIKRNIFFQKKAGLAARLWRRVRDSNPGCWRTPVCSPRRAAQRGPLQSRRFCGSAVRHRAAGRRDLPSAASAAQDGGSSKNGATIVHFIGVPAGPTAGAEPCSPVNPFFLDGNFSSAAFFENRREARRPFQKKAGLAARLWRRVRDSNPRCWRTPVCSPLRAAQRGPLHRFHRLRSPEMRAPCVGRRHSPARLENRRGACRPFQKNGPCGPPVAES